jgi:enoyl-CoA hydratase
MVDEPELVTEQRGVLRILRINRPAARNALTQELMIELESQVREADRDADTRAVVLTGTGEDAFCAGMDLRDFADGSVSGVGEGLDAFTRVTSGTSGIPLIGAANGTAVAGGFELLLGCDLVVASESARFGLPEVRRGMMAGGGGTLLSARIPLAMALELTLTGDLIDAERARSLGLVNRVVAPAEVLDVALEVANRVARNGPLAIRATKEVVWAAATDVDRARQLAAEWQPRVYESEDADEGARAFIERRDPVWKGR